MISFLFFLPQRIPTVYQHDPTQTADGGDMSMINDEPAFTPPINDKRLYQETDF